jgi:hypothetical protein
MRGLFYSTAQPCVSTAHANPRPGLPADRQHSCMDTQQWTQGIIGGGALQAHVDQGYNHFESEWHEPGCRGCDLAGWCTSVASSCPLAASGHDVRISGLRHVPCICLLACTFQQQGGACSSECDKLELRSRSSCSYSNRNRICFLAR